MTEEKMIEDLVFGYKEAMLFCGVIDNTLPEDDSDPNIHDCSMDIITEDLDKKIVERCCIFYLKNRYLIEATMLHVKDDPYDYERMGNDLFFTSHGHGVGFWDRPELGDFGDSLTVVVDDGKVVSPYALNEVFYNGEVIDG